ncbi:hyaluronidase-2-like protein [Lates japonicus]|uniref:Hyaluronidase n=1 Tax=Lates japonicus TaxID=270547 RepID=A0AAD3QW99_LATJO|nr:hyaluronidase-2-like protein [Lates japonicus]
MPNSPACVFLLMCDQRIYRTLSQSGRDNKMTTAWLWQQSTASISIYLLQRLTGSCGCSLMTDLMHTLGESASLGAAGVVLWGELKFAKSKRQCILLRDYIQTALGPSARDR